MLRSRVLCLVLSSSGVVAQHVTLSAQLTAPLTVTTWLAGQSDVRIATGVPGFPSSTLSAGGEHVAARQEADAFQSSFLCSLSLQHDLEVVMAPTQQAQVTCTSDMLLTLQALAPTVVELRIVASFVGSAGAPASMVEVDVLDDGVLEYQAGQQVPPPLPMLLDALPLSVRLRATSSLSLPGTAQLRVAIEVVPLNLLTQVHLAAEGCSPSANLSLQKSFDGGIELWPWSYGVQHPVPLVFGFGLQPSLLPASVPLPCLLLPAPDIVVLPPLAGSFSLPLPTSLRPVTFWVQGVVLSPLGLPTTTAYRIAAF